MDIVYSCPPTKASLSRYRSILSKIEKYRQEALERSQREMQATVRLCKKFWIWFSYLGKHAKVWVSWPHVSAARWIAIHEPSSRDEDTHLLVPGTEKHGAKLDFEGETEVT
jgi:hypothetical protein